MSYDIAHNINVNEHKQPTIIQRQYTGVYRPRS